ncbi:MAG: PilZ domain-containing protein [Candidatus Omnitrophica bacterium]|nr:PilZ domain-containing protein [Candidatus Omnitrophota bacterium]
MLQQDGQRRHSRVRDDIPVSWYIDRLGISSRGILRNISVSGALLETKVLVSVEPGMLVTLKSIEAQESIFVPPLARLVWGKAAREGKGYFFYGLEFKEPSGDYTRSIGLRVEDKMNSSMFGLGSGIADTSGRLS